MRNADLHIVVVLCVVASGCFAQATGDSAPLVGAIRWDAWHGEQGVPGKAVQDSLGPKKWHYRLPFFAEVLGEDKVRIDGSSQEVMDKEIAYAAGAGLDYWAFVTYAPDDPMSLGLKRYLSSRQRSRIRFCLITECQRWRDPKYVERLVDLTTEPGYLTVLNGRPVLYLGFLTSDVLRKDWANGSTLGELIDGLRASVKSKGKPDPYIVILDFNPQQGRKWLDELGCEAISSYATQGGGKAQPYAQLARHAEAFWDRCRSTGAQVVPIIMAGWDRRPRVEHPVPWEKEQKLSSDLDRYYEPPKPQELAGHASQALKWLNLNRASAQAGLAIIYAWNENDEGGWLVPTLSEGRARLDALGRVLGRSRH
jgi:hypothetical protein